MNSGGFPDRDTVDEKRGGERRTREDREEAKEVEEEEHWGEMFLRPNHGFSLKWGVA